MLQDERYSYPFDRYEKEFLYLIEKHQVLVVVSDTGSGKSTRIPQYLFSSGRYNSTTSTDSDLPGHIYRHQIIGITQPRRVAAVQLADRVAKELKCSLGTTVGFAVRFKDLSDQEHTQIKFVTEGLLIREILGDPLLMKYSVLIVDEVHERNINTDIILGLLRCILLKRNDLKLILCSATIDIDQITNFFEQTAEHEVSNQTKLGVLVASGRSYPIEIFYRQTPVANYLDASVETAISIHERAGLASGKILIFLTGLEEVDYVLEKLSDYAQATSTRLDTKKLHVMPLHASLPPEEISKVFDEYGHHTRVCIVSTNVAETSLTIDGVAFVIDCGFAKMKFYDHITGIDSLVRVPVSKGAAEQRAGRAGRTRKGCVYRLYTEEQYKQLEINTKPEIQRSSLTDVVNLLMSIGVENPLGFPLVSPLPTRELMAALETLYALGSINLEGKLTKAGELMSTINLEPKLSKILVSPETSGCTLDACRVVSLLQIRDIYAKPKRSRCEPWAEKKLKNLCATEGDIISYLNMLNAFTDNDKSKKWAERRNLNYQAMMNALEISSKLEAQLASNGIAITSSRGRVEHLQRSIVSGLFLNAAYLHPSGDYKTIRGGQTVYIHPTSVLNDITEKPNYVVFSEIQNTTKPYMRHLMSVERNWLLEAAPEFYVFATETELSRIKCV